MVCSRQPRSFQGVHPHGRPNGFRGSFISSRRPLIVSSISSSVATDLPALFPRELRRQSEIHLHSWFAKHHKNKPTQKKPSGWMTGRITGCSVCYAYWPACLSPKRTPLTVRNSPPHLVRQTPQKQTHPKNLCMCVVSALPLLLPQKQTHPKKNSPAGWRDGLRVALCVVSALPLLLPQKQIHSKNLCLCVVSVLPLLLPQKQTHPKKRRSVWMTGRT